MAEDKKNKTKSKAPEFNPIKEDIAGKRAARVKWTTKIIEDAIKGLEQGKKLVANPFYENNTRLLKADLVYTRTKEEVLEWQKCKDDIIYFANTYAKLMTPEGVKNITLRDYQIDYLKHLQANRLSIYCACRQCAKTTTSAIFMLHYLLFNPDKTAMVLGNKRTTAVEILKKIKDIFIELPFFLKPGTRTWNESKIGFDNNCMCMAEATTLNSGIGFTLHCVLLDEFAHLPSNIKESFYNNIFPTISAAKARLMITSTQNGNELFCRIYTAAENGENEYGAFRTDWWQVPEWNPEKRCWEKRDETWHKLQVANFGSEENFERQFGSSFVISDTALIQAKTLIDKKRSLKHFVQNTELICNGNNFWRFDPQYVISELRNDYFCVTCDLAEGKQSDYTVFTLSKMFMGRNSGEVSYKTVAFFRCNTKDLKECAMMLVDFLQRNVPEQHYMLSIEYNTYGALFSHYLTEYVDKYAPSNFSKDVILKYYNESKTKFTYGLRITHSNKLKCCTLFKSAYEHGDVINDSHLFYNELQNFIDATGNGTYRASFGHDDLVMSQIQLIAARECRQLKNLEEEYIANNGVHWEENTNDDDNVDIFGGINNIKSPYDYMFDNIQILETRFNQPSRGDVSLYDMI